MLTHVCIWSGKEWKKITVEKATVMHPGGTVSAQSGLFMCELCGQYVTLTDGNIQTRHFRHSADEESKDCPERTFGPPYAVSYDALEHSLPIRIVDISSASFRFEIGLIRVPNGLIGKEFQLTIRTTGAGWRNYVFGKERINTDGITYLPVGEKPSETYRLSFQNENVRLKNFWPESIKGIDPHGTLFDKSSGKKLPYDADVAIGTEYYLLKHGELWEYRHQREESVLKIQQVAREKIEYEIWNLYVVSASEFHEEAAKFYLEYHCRLTEHPISMQPVWPMFIEGSYVIKHHQENMFVLVNGNVDMRTFPPVELHRRSGNLLEATLYEVRCNSRQQLISVGRTQALKYAYFWKEPLNQEGTKPSVLVTDLTGAEVLPGKINVLPQRQTLRVKAEFDGKIVVFQNRCVVFQQMFVADEWTIVDELSYDTRVQVLAGLDVIWQADFTKQQQNADEDENAMLMRITKCAGVTIPAPHALCNMAVGLQRYPQICQWIRKQMKVGTISEQAYRRLQELYCKINAKQ